MPTRNTDAGLFWDHLRIESMHSLSSCPTCFRTIQQHLYPSKTSLRSAIIGFKPILGEQCILRSGVSIATSEGNLIACRKLDRMMKGTKE